MANANRENQVKIPFSPTFQESRYGEHGYTKDHLTEDELRSYAAPALDGFKGESLQQARQTIDGEKNPLGTEAPFDTTQLTESHALDVLSQQQGRDNLMGHLGASNAHLQRARR